MNLKNHSQCELDQKIKSLAQRERDLLHEVLLTIKEIDLRRSYLELGYGSLFEYLVQGVGYSEGSAQRRIDAARLIRELPCVAEKIQSGEIKLNQISLVQRAAREVKRINSKEVSAVQKMEILKGLCQKNHAETQKEVATFFALPINNVQTQSAQADQSVRIEFTVSKEVFAKIQQAQELLSHSVPTRDLACFLEYLTDKVIHQKIGKGPIVSTTATVAVVETLESTQKDIRLIKENSKIENNTKSEENSKKAKGVSLRTHKMIRARHRCCQYIDSITGKKCQSKWQTQVDHKQSRWAGGSHEANNLQLLCAAHNKIKYQKEAGIQYIS